MADVGEKVSPRPFQLVHLRDIARHHQQLFIAIGHHANFKMTAVIQHQIERFGKIAVFQIIGKFRVAQEVKDVLPVIVRPAQIQDLLGQTVAPEHHPFFGGQHHRIRQRLRPAAKALNQASQLTAALFITHLHLVQSVKQRLPAAAARRRRHAAINPQPPRQAHQIPEMPDKKTGHCRQ